MFRKNANMCSDIKFAFLRLSASKSSFYQSFTGVIPHIPSVGSI